MTLEKKIGQMMELEINIISYDHPEFYLPNLLNKDRVIIADSNKVYNKELFNKSKEHVKS